MKTLGTLSLATLLIGTARADTIYWPDGSGRIAAIQGTFNFAPINNDNQSETSGFQISALEDYAYAGYVKYNYWQVNNNSADGAIIAGIWCSASGWVNGQTGGSSNLKNMANQAFPNFYPATITFPGQSEIGFQYGNSFLAGYWDSAASSFVQTPSTGMTGGEMFNLLQDPGGPGLVADLDSGAFKIVIEVLEPNGQLDTFISVPENASTAGLLLLGLIPIGLAASRLRPKA